MEDFHDKCPMGDIHCIFHALNDDEDYCFSPRMRFGIHAKCIQNMNDDETYQDYIYEFRDDETYQDYIYEIRNEYMPAFTYEQTEIYMKWHAPSEYICCRGCRDGCRGLLEEENAENAPTISNSAKKMLVYLITCFIFNF
jgi:hypothetical protein